MDTKTILFIFLAAIVSIAVVVFQYFYKQKRRGKLMIWLACIRFLTLFVVLLLLINPKLVKHDYYTQKSKLLWVFDGSASVGNMADTLQLKGLMDKVGNSEAIGERFELSRFRFDSELILGDSLSFNGKETNISNALSRTTELNGQDDAVIVLLSDGNQTFGTDYQFMELGQNITINTVILGDTTNYEDLQVAQLNSNRYAFLGNKFPVETTIRYQGESNISTNLTISLDGRRVHREALNFSKNQNSKTITTLLSAEAVGFKSVVVEIEALSNEKNIRNNRKESALEVIDEKTNVLLVSNFLHPDIGALKKSIESNEQRNVTLAGVNGANSMIDDADVVILYQPTAAFKSIYEKIESAQLPSFTVTGTKTDYAFLNSSQNWFSTEVGYPEQEIFGTTNNGFVLFDISQLDLGGFPPLLSNVGPVTISENAEEIFGMQIKGTVLESPLMAVRNSDNAKSAVLFGENIWQWRAQNYRNSNDFKSFDEFMGKLMVFLSQSGKRERLTLDYQNIFEGTNDAKIRASFFDEAYALDPNAKLNIKVANEVSGETVESPLLFKGGYFESSLNNLESGNYSFTVTENSSTISKSGSFKILEFDAEQQFLTADKARLSRLAKNNRGRSFYMNTIEDLIEDLTENPRYVPLQKSRQKVVSLIDFRVLLALIALTLASEWFIRKYNGLL